MKNRNKNKDVLGNGLKFLYHNELGLLVDTFSIYKYSDEGLVQKQYDNFDKKENIKWLKRSLLNMKDSIDELLETLEEIERN